MENNIRKNIRTGESRNCQVCLSGLYRNAHIYYEDSKKENDDYIER